MVPIFLWFKSVQSSLIFIFLCFSCLTHYPVPGGRGRGGGGEGEGWGGGGEVGTPLSGGDAQPDGVWFLVFRVFVLIGVSTTSIFVLNGVSLHGLRC